MEKLAIKKKRDWQNCLIKNVILTPLPISHKKTLYKTISSNKKAPHDTRETLYIMYSIIMLSSPSVFHLGLQTHISKDLYNIPVLYSFFVSSRDRHPQSKPHIYM